MYSRDISKGNTNQGVTLDTVTFNFLTLTATVTSVDQVPYFKSVITVTETRKERGLKALRIWWANR